MVEEPDDAAGLAAAIAHALREDSHPARPVAERGHGAAPELLPAASDLARYTRASVDRTIADELLPRLLG